MEGGGQLLGARGGADGESFSGYKVLVMHDEKFLEICITPLMVNNTGLKNLRG